MHYGERRNGSGSGPLNADGSAQIYSDAQLDYWGKRYREQAVGMYTAATFSQYLNHPGGVEAIARRERVRRLYSEGTELLPGPHGGDRCAP